jgi:hypothetical protein
MKKFLALYVLTFFYSFAFGNIYTVGPTRIYTSPNALYLAAVVSAGDTIQIDSGDYAGVAALANWAANSLVIQGTGGRPHMIANGQNIGGKGIWITSGNNITVENIEFSGSTVPDANGAGIRAEGIGLVIRYCYFHDNENGILTNNPNAGDVLIEYSEFNHNGFGDGFTHNVYVGHVNKLTFQYNYSHHANEGHNLKSRASENIILYNRIMDEETGNSSRLIDLPNGGFSLIMGNLLMQGDNSPNNNMVGYGLEGLSNPLSELYFVNNTMVNKRVASCRFLHIQAGTSVAQVFNNIFAGTGTVITGSTTGMSNNIEEININNIMFVNEPNYNYAISAGSPAINGGIALSSVNNYNLIPDKSYQHPLFFSARILNGIIDIGAYEYNSTVLPVRLTNFNLVPSGNTILLQWTSVQEINSHSFETQSSTDGINFSTIGHVAASINSNQPHNYQHQHCCPVFGNNYYRLKITDQNGTFNYSEIKSIKIKKKENFLVYPNPVTNQPVIVSFAAPLLKASIARLYNNTGNLVSQKIANKGENKISIEINLLPAGVYLLLIEGIGIKKIFVF